MLLPTATPVAPSVGLNVETVGAVVSAAATVVKSYVLVPAKVLLALSLIVPEAKTTKYWVPLDRLLVGSMVSWLPERVSWLLDAALNDSTRVPEADPLRSSMFPVPRVMVSLKVKTMLLPTATPVAPSVGLNVETVGAVVSAAAEIWPTLINPLFSEC